MRTATSATTTSGASNIGSLTFGAPVGLSGGESSDGITNPIFGEFVPIAQAGWRREHNRDDPGAQAQRLERCYQMASGDRAHNMTMHDFEAKHWFIAALIILLAVGAFAYSWS